MGLSGERILIIKLGALGDFVQALGPMAAIAAHHPNAEITLLTTAPFRALAGHLPWVDRVLVDERPRPWRIDRVLALRRTLRAPGFDRVYDLQTSGRSAWYFRLMGRPEWSGVAPGCALPHANPDRDHMHTLDRQREQLAMAGIAEVPPPDLSWLEAPLPADTPAAPCALLVPGGAPHRPAKRWPAEGYAALGRRLKAERDLTPVLLGTAGEADLTAAITADCPGAVDLAGRTDLPQLAALGRRAGLAVGNDTGPMHLLAVAGAPSVVLFSHDSDPALCAPRGPRVTIRRAPDLADLALETVMDAVAAVAF